jgi:hypothetical protein
MMTILLCPVVHPVNDDVRILDQLARAFDKPLPTHVSEVRHRQPRDLLLDPRNKFARRAWIFLRYPIENVVELIARGRLKVIFMARWSGSAETLSRWELFDRWVSPDGGGPLPPVRPSIAGRYDLALPSQPTRVRRLPAALAAMSARGRGFPSLGPWS